MVELNRAKYTIYQFSSNWESVLDHRMPTLIALIKRMYLLVRMSIYVIILIILSINTAYHLLSIFRPLAKYFHFLFLIEFSSDSTVYDCIVNKMLTFFQIIVLYRALI